MFHIIYVKGLFGILILVISLSSFSTVTAFQAEKIQDRTPEGLTKKIEDVLSKPRRDVIDLAREIVRSKTPEPIEVNKDGATLRELGDLARNQISQLSRVNGKISDEALHPVWVVLMDIHEHPHQDSREVFKNLFKQVSTLDLPAKQSLTTYRVLGQDAYFNGKNEVAEKYFNLAFETFAKADDLGKKDLAFAMGNIIYLNGLVLKEKSDSQSDLSKNDELLLKQPLLWKKTPLTTKVDLLLRLGRAYSYQKKYFEAEKVFEQGLKLSKEDNKLNLRYRIDFEIGLVNVDVAVGNLDQKSAIKVLENLKDELTGKQYAQLDFLIVALVKFSMEEREANPGSEADQRVLSLLTELKDYYMGFVEKDHSLTRQRLQYLKTTSGLVNFAIEVGNMDIAKSEFDEVVEFANPSESWFQSLPPKFVESVRMKSVLIDENKENKDRKKVSGANGTAGFGLNR